MAKGVRVSFAERFPHLVAEWHPRNELPPTAYRPRSSVKVWWRCAEGHEWQAWIYDRGKGRGCPYCSYRRTGSLTPARPPW